MPPKMKLHKEKGKAKSIVKGNQSNTQNLAPQPLQGDSESRQQFEVELLWCIQQLQSALESGKLSQKQMQDTNKTVNSLMSNSTPLIKKRQLMRGTFGDYRAKMSEEERKYSRINSKIILSSAKPSKKSVFVKKAPFLTSGKDFKFNFKQPEMQEQIGNIENAVNQIEKLNLEEKCNAGNSEDVKLKETTKAMRESITTLGKSESSEGTQNKIIDIDGEKEKANIYQEQSDEPPSKIFQYQPSVNEFRFNFTMNSVQ